MSTLYKTVKEELLNGAEYVNVFMRAPRHDPVKIKFVRIEKKEWPQTEFLVSDDGENKWDEDAVAWESVDVIQTPEKPPSSGHDHACPHQWKYAGDDICYCIHCGEHEQHKSTEL